MATGKKADVSGSRRTTRRQHPRSQNAKMPPPEAAPAQDTRAEESFIILEGPATDPAGAELSSAEVRPNARPVAARAPVAPTAKPSSERELRAARPLAPETSLVSQDTAEEGLPYLVRSVARFLERVSPGQETQRRQSASLLPALLATEPTQCLRQCTLGLKTVLDEVGHLRGHLQALQEVSAEVLGAANAQDAELQQYAQASSQAFAEGIQAVANAFEQVLVALSVGTAHQPLEELTSAVADVRAALVGYEHARSHEQPALAHSVRHALARAAACLVHMVRLLGARVAELAAQGTPQLEAQRERARLEQELNRARTQLEEAQAASQAWQERAQQAHGHAAHSQQAHAALELENLQLQEALDTSHALGDQLTRALQERDTAHAAAAQAQARAQAQNQQTEALAQALSEAQEQHQQLQVMLEDEDVLGAAEALVAACAHVRNELQEHERYRADFLADAQHQQEQLNQALEHEQQTTQQLREQLVALRSEQEGLRVRLSQSEAERALRAQELDSARHALAQAQHSQAHQALVDRDALVERIKVLEHDQVQAQDQLAHQQAEVVVLRQQLQACVQHVRNFAAQASAQLDGLALSAPLSSRRLTRQSERLERLNSDDRHVAVLVERLLHVAQRHLEFVPPALHSERQQCAQAQEQLRAALAAQHQAEEDARKAQEAREAAERARVSTNQALEAAWRERDHALELYATTQQALSASTQETQERARVQSAEHAGALAELEERAQRAQMQLEAARAQAEESRKRLQILEQQWESERLNWASERAAASARESALRGTSSSALDHTQGLKGACLEERLRHLEEQNQRLCQALADATPSAVPGAALTQELHSLRARAAEAQGEAAEALRQLAAEQARRNSLQHSHQAQCERLRAQLLQISNERDQSKQAADLASDTVRQLRREVAGLKARAKTLTQP